MNLLRLRWILLILTCVAQLGYGANSIWSAERVIADGSLYRFRTTPIDPVDPLRGRYVRLNFSTFRFPKSEHPNVEKGSVVYGLLERDDEGFGRVASIATVPPAAGDYLTLEVWQDYGEDLSVRLPFDRYYLDEHRAPAVERQLRDRNNRAAALVRVEDGHGVIVGLEIDEG